MTEKLAGVISFSFHIGGFLKDTLHLDTTEKGAYLMLLLAHYQTGSEGLPDEDKKLARITGVTTKKWKQIRPTLMEYFDVHNGRLIHKKVCEVLQKIHELSAKQRAKSLKRWDSGDAVAIPQESQPITNNKDKNNDSKNRAKKKVKSEYDFSLEGSEDNLWTDDKEIRFDGDVIKLNQGDWKKLRNKHNLTDEQFSSLIEDRDRFLKKLPKTDRRSAAWWMPTVKWLESENSREI